MTSVLPEEESNAAKMKQKLISNSPVKEETRSFLNFSRENLSISHSDIEQGFNKPRRRPSRNTILSVAAIMIAIICFGIETWKLRCSPSNMREIEQLKRDVESLKHRFLEQDLMDELKAFEEQLYAEESTEDNDLGEADIDNADYDSYDDDSSASHDYSSDYHTPAIYSSKSSNFVEITSTPIPISTSPGANSNKTIIGLLATLRKVEAKRGQEFEKNVRENHKNIERERLKEEHKARLSHEERISDASSTKHKRDINVRDVNNSYIEESINSKRSVSDHVSENPLTNTSNYQSSGRYYMRETHISRVRSYESDESNMNDNSGINPISHPPKKYYTRAHLGESLVHDDQLSKEIIRSNRYTSENTETVGGEKVNWRNAHHDITGNKTDIRRPRQNFDVAAREFRRRLTRRHLRAPRQVYAIHYGADSTLFSASDEHYGNGRARHSNGIFKAWRPSDWVADLGMNRHFTLAIDGKLTVHEPGLYLVYAQIHYLDEHDENGFHLLVNGKPILQCMVYSPGIGHKSRSCFSAQVTVLQADDHLVLKDIGSARYTLFQHDKSFFGLVKFGEPRQQQRHQPQ